MPHKKKLTQRQIRGNEPTRLQPKDIQVSSRPTGTPKERNVLLTGKSPVEQEEIQTASALETIAKTDPARAAKIASQSTTNAEIRARAQEDIGMAQQTEFPDLTEESVLGESATKTNTVKGNIVPILSAGATKA